MQIKTKRQIDKGRETEKYGQRYRDKDRHTES